MEITLKVSEIILINTTLNELKTSSMSGRLSYQIKQYKKKFSPIVESFNETKDSLIKEKYGIEKKEEDKVVGYEVPQAVLPDFMKEIETVLNQEEKLDLPNKFKVSDFDDIKVPGNFHDVMESVIED